MSLPTVTPLGSSLGKGKWTKIKLERARGIYKQKLYNVLTCPLPRVAACVAAAARVVCALPAASPASYLSPVVAVGLKLRQ